MMNKKVKVFLVAIILITGILTGILVTRNPLKQDPVKVMIKNGSTGEETVLEGENAEEMMQRLSDVHSKLSAIHLWTSGYGYIIRFQDNGDSDEVTVRGSDTYVSGLLKYKTDADLLKIIEEFEE